MEGEASRHLKVTSICTGFGLGLEAIYSRACLLFLPSVPPPFLPKLKASTHLMIFCFL